MDDRASTPAVQDLRNVAADLHHGLRQRRLVGEADAIAHALTRAADAGVPQNELERMATQQFRSLFDEEARRLSAGGRLRRWRARRLELSVAHAPPPQRQLGQWRPDDDGSGGAGV